jgi:hypothetical protein
LSPGEDDEGVGQLAEVLEAIEDAAQVIVQAGDAGVIVGQVPADDLRRARPRRQQFVAHGHLAVVEGVHGQEARRERDVGGRIHVHELLGRDARVVRHGRGQVDEEGLVVDLRWRR